LTAARAWWAPRVTLRSTMIAVAVVALGLGAWRHWKQWRRIYSVHPNTIANASYISARPVDGPIIRPPVEGEEIPISIDYVIAFDPPMPPLGFTFCVRVEVWVEDLATGRIVDQVSFDRYLVAGVHEEYSGTMNWSARITGEGYFTLHESLSYTEPLGQFVRRSRGTLWQLQSTGYQPLYRVKPPASSGRRTQPRIILPPSLRQASSAASPGR
jgi:hypothetical protein